MGIERTDVKYWASRLETDTANNGGRRGYRETACGVFESHFPSWSVDERAVGTVRYRKYHLRNHSTTAGRLARLYMHGVTGDDDIRTLIAADYRGTQDDLAGSEAQYGTGALNAAVLAGASTITVAVPIDWPVIFRTGDRIIITNQATAGGAGAYQQLELTGATYNAGVWTLTTATQVALNYSATDTVVGSMIEIGDWAATVASSTVSYAAGDLDDAQIALTNAGGESETYAVGFTSATAYTITGDTLGALGTYSTSTTAAPVHPVTGATLLSIPPAAWSGTFADGDAAEIVTEPADLPVWMRREIPEGGIASYAEGTEIAYVVESVQ